METSLNEMLKTFMDKYASELTEARASGNYKRSFGGLVRKDIAESIQSLVDKTIYKVKGSVGAGRWTDVPWIAVFDKRITTSAQKDVYIVYLLNKDTKELYLTLNQGATDVAQGGGQSLDGKSAFTGIATASNKKITAMLTLKAKDIRKKIEDECDLKYGQINTGSSAYDAGCIYYKKYDLNNMPEDGELFQDLSDFLKAYGLYYDRIYVKQGFREREDGETEMTIKETLEQINRYIVAKGFIFDETLIENFYLSIKSKPFVLLAGTSGTGKTRLVRLFAEAIGAFADGRYLQVPVKPDWSDSTDLFGHINLDKDFVPGAIIEFIKKAAEDKRHKPYILCLDEMNLARVEYYMSDFLSIIETRDWENGRIVTDRLVPKVCYAGCDKAVQDYADLIFPENLYLIGTVNMDETTFPFSKKVLDRANTIEFSFVDFSLPELSYDVDAKAVDIENEFLRSDYLRLRIDAAERWESVKNYNNILTAINEIMKESDMHFGYRMRDEMIFYMLYREKTDLLTENMAFDNQILQKILPRIQGSTESIANTLRRLFTEVCAGPYESKNGMSDSHKMENYLRENGNASYPRSAEKICRMLRRFEEDDFTSYWV